MVLFSTLMVSMGSFAEEGYHLERQYWIDSNVVTRHCVPVFSVIIDLEIRIFFDLAVLNVRFLLDLVLVRKLPKDLVVRKVLERS